MNTLYDFITHVKGIEYILSVTCIAAYILYWEVLKPKPFKALAEAGKEDIGFVKASSPGTIRKTIGRVAAAPFIGIAYVVSLPFVFAYALGSSAVNGLFGMIGKEVSFGWRPSEAYLAGKKKGKKEKTEIVEDEKK